jgi:3-oxoacyl-[acyl-carrier protein] reductase
MNNIVGSTSPSQRVIITGAAGVIGTWISEAFAREGAQLLLVDARQEPLDALAAQLGTTVATCCADLSSSEGRTAVLAASDALWDSPDVLVNNAGLYPHGDLLEVTDDQMRKIFAVNVEAPFALTRDFARRMVTAGIAGSVINISSGAATVPAAGGGCYSASKSALETFTKVYALELASEGIRVNTVQPGFAPGSEVSELDDAYIARMVSHIPLGRTAGPLDAASAVLFLASERAGFITGATIAVDGGRTAGTFRSAARP